MDLLARCSRLLMMLSLVCLSGAVARGQSGSVQIGIANLIVQGELNQFKSSIPFRINAAPAYQFSITGNVHGEGPIFSLLVPSSEPAATAFEAIHQGMSSALQGSVPNPGSQLPANILSEQVSSGTNGAFNATFSLSIDATGLLSFSVTNVGIVINGQPDTTDRLVFDSGTVTVTALSADVSVATLSATNITTHGANLLSSVFCPNAFQAWFVYSATGTSLSSTSSIVSLASSGAAQTVSIPVTGLLAHTVYHYEAVGSDVTGPSHGAELTFKTLDTPPVSGTFSAFAGLSPIAIPVLAHASDADGDGLKVTAVTSGHSGKAAIKSGGSGVTYQFTSAYLPTDQFTYTVSDGFGGASTGVVNLVNYAKLAGTYSAVLLNPDAQNLAAGFLRVAVGAAGTCSGSVTIGGVAYSFTGALDATGHLFATLSSSAPYGTAITLNMVQNGGGYQLNAGVVMNATSLAASLLPAAPAAAGAYTMLIPPASGAGYQGTGYALVGIAPSGLVTITGALADGAAFSCPAVMNATGQIDFYSLLYAASNRGSLTGMLAVSGSGNGLISGTMVWTKPALASAGIDRGPFALTLTGSGGRYVAPVRAPVLQFGSFGNLGKVLITGGNLNTPIQRAISISPANQVTFLEGGNQTLAMTLQPATGVFAAHFIDPLTGETRSIHGVCVEGSETGGGYFPGDSEGGAISIGP